MVRQIVFSTLIILFSYIGAQEYQGLAAKEQEALKKAINLGQFAIIKVFLENNPQQAKSSLLHDLLEVAVKTGCYPIAKLLLRYGAQGPIKKTLKACYKYNLNPLGGRYAIQSKITKHHKLENLLFDYGIELIDPENYSTLLNDIAVDQRSLSDTIGSEMLPYVNGDAQTLKSIFGDNLEYVKNDKYYGKWLVCAAARGHKGIFELYIENGIKLCNSDGSQIQKWGYSLADLALRNGYKDLADLIIKHGGEYRVLSPLHAAVYRKDTKSLMELIQSIGDKKESLNIKNCNGDTPLHIAARMVDMPNFSILMEAGADLYVPNRKSKTPIQIAFQNPCPCDLNPIAINLIFSRLTALFEKSNNLAIQSVGSVPELTENIALYLAGAHLKNVSKYRLDNAPVSRGKVLSKTLRSLDKAIINYN
ncbi:MAG TPA: ankyrin repeat domain-containing protein [Candidatus Babeliaceae bacterium]|nr:ankyrin repeat domain-containing protein [Candidatus Babeliaceae bacterium]